MMADKAAVQPQRKQSVDLKELKVKRDSLIPIISSIGDGDGEVDASSLMRFIGTHRDLQKQHAQVKIGLAAIVVVLLFSILANFFTTQAVIDMSKDFKPNSAGDLTTSNGIIVQTTNAEFHTNGATLETNSGEVVETKLASTELDLFDIIARGPEDVRKVKALNIVYDDDAGNEIDGNFQVSNVKIQDLKDAEGNVIGQVVTWTTPDGSTITVTADMEKTEAVIRTDGKTYVAPLKHPSDDENGRALGRSSKKGSGAGDALGRIANYGNWCGMNNGAWGWADHPPKIGVIGCKPKNMRNRGVTTWAGANHVFTDRCRRKAIDGMDAICLKHDMCLLNENSQEKKTPGGCQCDLNMCAAIKATNACQSLFWRRMQCQAYAWAAKQIFCPDGLAHAQLSHC